MTTQCPLTAVLVLCIVFFPLVAHSACVPGAVEANVWTSHGPEGGPILSLAIDPARPATLYAETSGGVFKSTDGSGNWSNVHAPAIDLVRPAIVYAGTWGGGVFAIHQGK